MLITAAEFLASREANAAGLTGTPVADVEAVITDVEADLYEVLGYNVEAAGVTSVTVTGRATRFLILPQRVRTITQVASDGSVVSSLDYSRNAGGFRLASSGLWGDGARIVITGAFGFVEGERWRVIAEEILRKAVALELQSTELEGMPSAPPGAYITGIQSESTAFSFFTPSGDSVFVHPTLDRRVRQIMHPLKGADKLRSVVVGGGAL